MIFAIFKIKEIQVTKRANAVMAYTLLAVSRTTHTISASKLALTELAAAFSSSPPIVPERVSDSLSVYYEVSVNFKQ